MKFLLYIMSMAVLALACQRAPSLEDKKLTFAIGQHRETYKLFSCATHEIKMSDALSKKDSLATADYSEAIYLRNYKTATGKTIESPLLLFFLNPKADVFGSHVYAANSEYFEWLKPVSAVHPSVERQKVAVLKKGSLLEKKIKGLDLAILLMQAEAIQTYNHLYADITVEKEQDNDSEYKAYFDVVYHICTSKCYHPKYKFVYIFDKKTSTVFISSEDKK